MAYVRQFHLSEKIVSKKLLPLLSIDQKVESVVGHEILSFLNLYKDYHQVLMDLSDAAKTNLITNLRVYTHKKMPFGLKNVGATYQSLMDHVFRGQIRRNLKVYVNDIVTKSKTSKDFPHDLLETLQTIQQVGLKLNLEKCVFPMRKCKFLGY